MSGQKPPQKRAYDALVGTAIAVIVIAAATFGELGPKHRAAPAVFLGSVQAGHHPLKVKTLHLKPHCFAGRDCPR